MMKTYEQYNIDELIIGNIYEFVKNKRIGIYIGKKKNNSTVFIDISQLLGIVLYFEYKNCFIDSYGSINKNIINKNLTDIEFIMEDATRYSKIKDTESVSLSGTAYNEYKELFNNYMEELNKNKDIKIIIDSEELGLL